MEPAVVGEVSNSQATSDNTNKGSVSLGNNTLLVCLSSHLLLRACLMIACRKVFLAICMAVVLVCRGTSKVLVKGWQSNLC